MVEAVETMLRGQMIVAVADDDTIWGGTAHWLIKESVSSPPDQAAVRALLSRSYDLELDRVEHQHQPVLTRASGDTLRVYVRPDGKCVRVNDIYMKGIESLLEDEDEGGNTIPARLTLRQADGRYSPIGIFEGDEMVAVIMPSRLINEHLLDGLSGGGEGTDD